MDSHNSKNDPVILMRQAKNGDGGAFGYLYEIYLIPVFRYIYLRVNDKEIANDLTQETFLKAFRSLERYQDRNKSPLAYFFTIARNTVIDFWKKKKEILLNNPEIFAKTSEPNVHSQEIIEKTEMVDAVKQALQQLTDEQQEVIILKFINELSNSEIAQLLGKSEEAIRQLQCRALKTLRQQLKESKLL